MIDRLQDLIGISFRELEQTLLRQIQQALSESLIECIEYIDQVIMQKRNKSRYQLKGFHERTVETVLGASVIIQRRYYLDRHTGKYLCLFDEVMGLPKHQQVSPGLAECMLLQGVLSSSYRGAAESIASLCGKPVVSHETVRQTVLNFGAGLSELEAERLKNPKGKRRVPVLFIEVDGMNVSLQRDSKKRVEERVLICHEGWEPRHPASSEYVLINSLHFHTQDEDFWEQASRFVYSHYDIDDDVIVIINGDRASWIRKGVEYFPNAIYQVDRFHLVRDIRRIFRALPEALARVSEALKSNDVTGATFMSVLAQEMPLLDEKSRKDAAALLKDLAKIPEATVDYRMRLAGKGIVVNGMRGLGAAESQIDSLSDRVKGRGRSWSRNGLAAMMQLICARNDGVLYKVVERVEAFLGEVRARPVDIHRLARQAVKQVANDYGWVKKGGVPVTKLGRTKTSGLSHFMNNVISGPASA